jgi:ABC-type multidrug transport system permease subunit
MKNKTFWIGLVAVFVLMQAIGYAVHQVWLDETYKGLANVFRAEAEIMDMMWMMMAGSVLSLFLFCYIFTKGYEGKGVAEGVRYGLLMGIFVSAPISVDNFVVYPLPGNLAVTWFVAGVLSFAVAGAVFAAIYKPSTA